MFGWAKETRPPLGNDSRGSGSHEEAYSKMWGWIAVGLGSFVALSVLIAFAFARVLSALTDTSELFESEIWSQSPPPDVSTP